MAWYFGSCHVHTLGVISTAAMAMPAIQVSQQPRQLPNLLQAPFSSWSRAGTLSSLLKVRMPAQDTWGVQIGDASGSHSPLSFGGFGSMLRHLGRLNQGIHAALQQDALDVGTLKGLQVPAAPAQHWVYSKPSRLLLSDEALSTGMGKAACCAALAVSC